MPPIPREVVALVTGASSGIGAEFARQLAARGHDLVLVARRRERLEELRDTLSVAHGVHVEVLVADLETAAGRDSVAQRLEQGGPWLLVNNAGFGTRGPVADLPIDREIAEVAVNVVAVHHLACVALQVNVRAGGGGILNVASQAGFQPLPYFATYAATKAFVLHFTEAIAVEARRSDVRVTALCPGPVQTEFFANVTERDAKLAGPVTIRADRCVRDALRSLDRGDVICTPGLAATAATRAVRLMPRALLRGAIGRVQEMVGVARVPTAEEALAMADAGGAPDPRAAARKPSKPAATGRPAGGGRRS